MSRISGVSFYLSAVIFHHIGDMLVLVSMCISGVARSGRIGGGSHRHFRVKTSGEQKILHNFHPKKKISSFVQIPRSVKTRIGGPVSSLATPKLDIVDGIVCHQLLLLTFQSVLKGKSNTLKYKNKIA